MKTMTYPDLKSRLSGGLAVVVGASGGIGQALVTALESGGQFDEVIGLSRRSTPALDLCDEASIATAVAHIAARSFELRLVINAAGFLHDDAFAPEKSLAQVDATHMAKAFAVNAIGPALLMKHSLPLLPRGGRSVFATLSARVGSIGDNRLGGWHSYRASKTALNHIVHTVAIELKRRCPEAVCVALHPGTVDSSLSSPFAKTGLDVQKPKDAAARILAVLVGLTPEQSGGFFDQHGTPLPW
jgi:NAD(P)-dependent dehydrogenase (short-subunit alcohol dehydrogenase family)